MEITNAGQGMCSCRPSITSPRISYYDLATESTPELIQSCWGFAEHVQEVLDFLFQYIRLLQVQGVVAWIFEEV